MIHDVDLLLYLYRYLLLSLFRQILPIVIIPVSRCLFVCVCVSACVTVCLNVCSRVAKILKKSPIWTRTFPVECRISRSSTAP